MAIASQREHVYLAVMGITGAGKSTFVRDCSKIDVKVGHGLESCTTQVEDFAIDYDDRLRVHLIDTPGFDDTDKSDTDILKDLASWLAQSYQREELLSGVLFLHSINAVRLNGGAKRNLAMFKKLCGQECFSSVVLATTHWDETDPAVGSAREKQLRTTSGMWLDMIEDGSHYMRHDKGEESAREILAYMIENRRPFKAAIQREMVEEGLSLRETQAGLQLSSDLLAMEKQHRAELSDLQKRFNEARERQDVEAEVRLQELRDTTQAQLDSEKRARSELTANLESIKQEKQEETRRSQAEAAKQLAEMSKVRLAHKTDKQTMEGQIKDLEGKLESIGRKNKAHVGEKGDMNFESWLKLGLSLLERLFTSL